MKAISLPLQNQWVRSLVIPALGSLFLALSAQLSFSFAFLSVPITGQTFAVMFLALCFGRKIATMAFLMYLAEGALGLPVFAQGKNLLLVGPTFGYLIGMLFASFVVGSLSDMGAKKSFWLSLASCYAGSVIVFAFGAWGLNFFIPSSSVFALGVAPFLIGDFIKNTLAAALVSQKIISFNK